MKLSIIIVSWNVSDLLASCLVSIDREIAKSGQIGASQVETIVVDNASTDTTVARVSAEFPWVRLVANQENSGFARANNQGMALSSGEYVLLLNPDTSLHEGALDELIRFLDEHPTAGAVGPRLENPDGSLQVSCYPALTLRGELWRLLRPDRQAGHGAYPMHQWSSSEPRQVDTVQGACLLIRRAVLDQVGLLDEAYYIYTEEVDLCTRMRRAGWTIYWLPTAQVTHYGGQSTQQVAPEMFIQLYASKVIYFRKQQGRVAALLYKLILLMAGLLRVVLSPATRFLGAARRQQYLRLRDNYRRLLVALPAL